MRKTIVRKVIVMMIAIMGTFLLTACGSDNDNKMVLDTEKDTEVAFEEESMSVCEETELSAEDIIAIAEEGFRVIKELDPEGMIEWTNIELLYYTDGKY